MRVVMKTHIGGTRNGDLWPDAGGEIDLPDYEAKDLITAGYAKEAPDAAPHDHVPAPSNPDPSADGGSPAPAEPGSDASGNPDPSAVTGPTAGELDIAERPLNSATKKAWVAYATAQGMTVEEAEAQTRNQLAELYPAEA